jgi:hypothetical protein
MVEIADFGIFADYALDGALKCAGQIFGPRCIESQRPPLTYESLRRRFNGENLWTLLDERVSYRFRRRALGKSESDDASNGSPRDQIETACKRSACRCFQLSENTGGI